MRPSLAADCYNHVHKVSVQTRPLIKTMSADHSPQMDSPNSAHVGRQPSIDRWAAVAPRMHWFATGDEQTDG